MRYESVYNIIRRILDTLFPPRERAKAVRSLTINNLDRLPPNRQPEKPFIRAVCDYREPAVRQVVKAAKYDGSRVAVNLMADVLSEEILSLCAENRIFASEIVITPVPLSNHRRREHGFNQSWRLAKAIEKQDGGETFRAKKLLKKTRKTPAQTSLSKAQRLKNITGAFTATSSAEELVIIIDDVTTTGATFTEAARALKAGGSKKVLTLAFAH